SVVVTSMLLIGILMAVAVFRSLLPVTAAIMLVPITGVFFVLDNRHMRQWKTSILILFVKDQLNIPAFSEFVSATPIIPQSTVHAMIESLGEPGMISLSNSILDEKFNHALETVNIIARKQQLRTILGAVALTGALTSISLLGFVGYRSALIV